MPQRSGSSIVTPPDTTLPPIGWSRSFAIFGGAAVLLFFVTGRLLPALAGRSSVEPLLLWFAAAGLILFPVLLLTGWALLRSEPPLAGGAVLWRDRLRFRRMDRGDWIWCLGAVVAMGAASAALLRWLGAVAPGLRLTPWFLEAEPLTGGRLWIVALWIPFFALTLFTEEVVWRGVLLPRQEVALGRFAWLANGAGWLLFHLAFGPAVLVLLLPIVVVLPYVVQRRRNSWVGVVVHAALNGPGFLATAFGLVP